MSGVRACDTELLQLGLTLPGFVERSKQIASLPSLGLLTLAGMTPRSHTVSYHEAPDAASAAALPSAAIAVEMPDGSTSSGTGFTVKPSYPFCSP